MRMPHISRERALAYVAAVLLALTLAGRVAFHGDPHAHAKPTPLPLRAEAGPDRKVLVHVVGTGRGRPANRRAGPRALGSERRRRGRSRHAGGRPGAPEHGHARGARLASRDRSGHRPEDSRLPDGARCLRLGGRARLRPRNRSDPAGRAQEGRPAVRALVRLPAPHLLVGALCAGLAVALLLPAPGVAAAAAAFLLATAGLLMREGRAACLAGALFVTGWWWGALRLDALDRSVLLGEIGRVSEARLEVTGPARRSTFEVRVPVRVLRFGAVESDERARPDLPRGRP